MNKTKPKGSDATKNMPKISQNSVMCTDFGSRKICNQNKSKIVAIPKIALDNLGSSSSEVKVELVQERDQKFIKLTPKGEKN